MSGALIDLLRRVRARAWLAGLLPVLPWPLAIGLAWLLPQGAAVGWPLWLGLLAVGLWCSFTLSQQLRRLNRSWLLGRLDQHRVELEDSAGLLDAGPEQLSPLQNLQRERVLARLAASPLPELRRRLPWRATVASALLAAVAVVWPWLPWPDANLLHPVDVAPGTHRDPVVQSLSIELEIQSPAYTGLPMRRSEQLAATVAQDSRLHWSLRFAIAPSSARLVFVDGRSLTLEPHEDRFEAEASFAASTLYRLEIEGAPAAADGALHRIEVVQDREPQITVIRPERTLTVIDTEQRQWPMQFDVEDDYGIAKAELVLSLAQGSGEQVSVSERRLAMSGEGLPTKQGFQRVLDLRALGFAQGDDLIARLEISDNRQPQAQTSRSPALILRWPSQPAAEGSGVEGLVQRTLPAYFRSQRQIIIDTEALIAERPKLESDTLLARSDALGVDQRILRMRYGQFLGEESEAGNLPGSGPAPDDEEDGHSDDDGHDHGDDHSSAPSAGFGEAGSLLAEVGHLHDMAEAATLLDPRTKALLRAALAEMWQSEGQLRLGKPEAALPFEYRALELIKQVQQANRIYLARVGLELPQVDFSRRLTGEDKPRSLAADQMLQARSEALPIARWWRDLSTAGAVPMQAISDWLGNSPTELADPLSALAELDQLRRSPDCQPCKQRLQQRLWPALPTPVAAPQRRAAGGAAGEHYLQATGALQ